MVFHNPELKGSKATAFRHRPVHKLTMQYAISALCLYSYCIVLVVTYELQIPMNGKLKNTKSRSVNLKSPCASPFPFPYMVLVGNKKYMMWFSFSDLLPYANADVTDHRQGWDEIDTLYLQCIFHFCYTFPFSFHPHLVTLCTPKKNTNGQT